MLEVELTLEQLREKPAKLGFAVADKETTELLATGYFVIVAAAKTLERPRKFQKNSLTN